MEKKFYRYMGTYLYNYIDNNIFAEIMSVLIVYNKARKHCDI